MNQSIHTHGLRNRYSVLILVLVLMLYVHNRVILIHPLIFIVWPTCVWLIIELYNEWKKDRYRLLLFIISFLWYLVATQLLVVEKMGGIFFDLEPFPNMTTISYFILLETTILYIYDSLVLHRTTYRSTLTYVGFASIIPWISPAIVETLILIRWVIEGTFTMRTFGKGLGASSLNDILFVYGFRNIVYSTAMFYLVVAGLWFSELMKTRRMNFEAKRCVDDMNKEWHKNAWNDPLSLLNKEEQQDFKNTYGQLDETQQKEILRSKVLPSKGIRLVDPKTL